MSNPKSNITRYSGYRLRFAEPRTYEFRRAALRKQVEDLMPIYQLGAMEPFFIDDALRNYAPIDVVMTALTEGELFLCCWGSEEDVVGVVMISEILHERKAKIDAYALPQWRESIAGRRAMSIMIKEIISYCFRPFAQDVKNPANDGLGLQKLKAEVCIDNNPGLRACAALGFGHVGTSPCDALFNGEPKDTVLLELLNPEYFTNAVSQISTGTSLQPSPELHSSPSAKRSISDRRQGDNEADGANGVDAPKLAPTVRNKSTRSSRSRKVRK